MNDHVHFECALCVQLEAAVWTHVHCMLVNIFMGLKGRHDAMSLIVNSQFSLGQWKRIRNLLTLSRAIFLNFFGQCEHWNGHSSLWMIWCSFSAPFAIKLFPHSSQMNGRSPVWMARTCACILTNLLNRLSQNRHGWMSFNSSGKWTTSCRCNCLDVANRFGHCGQRKPSSGDAFSASCWDRLCSS